jgi:hypothetical protein
MTFALTKYLPLKAFRPPSQSSWLVWFIMREVWKESLIQGYATAIHSL